MLAVVNLEERVPKDHPLRTIKTVADEALARLSPEFDRRYSKVGRASEPLERLLQASLFISLYSVRSERAFREELECNLLFRWFLDMNLMERSFDPTVFTKNRKRLLEHRVGQALFDEVVWEADRRGLLSDEHFSVDGTLIEAWPASRVSDGEMRGATARRRPRQPVGGLSWGEVEERDPPEQEGPRGQADEEGQGERGQAVIHGPRADGERQRAVDGLRGEQGHGGGGA